MILKHRDTEVLRFDWVQPFGAKNVEVNAAAERFLPLSFRDRVRKDPSALRHPDFVWPDNRLELIQYFLRNRIRDVVKYREKADCYLKVPDSSDTIKPIGKAKVEKTARQERSASVDLSAKIKATLKLFPTISRKRLAETFDVGPATIGRQLKALQEAGELKRVGSRKTGYWQVVSTITDR